MYPHPDRTRRRKCDDATRPQPAPESICKAVWLEVEAVGDVAYLCYYKR